MQFYRVRSGGTVLRSPRLERPDEGGDRLDADAEARGARLGAAVGAEGGGEEDGHLQ